MALVRILIIEIFDIAFAHTLAQSFYGHPKRIIIAVGLSTRALEDQAGYEDFDTLCLAIRLCHCCGNEVIVGARNECIVTVLYGAR
jgi:hypothetical protein